MERGKNPEQFTLISLGWQLDAVQRFVRGWSDAEILAWLATRGIVELRIPAYDGRPDTYTFSSLVAPGLEVGFFLRDGVICVVGDNTIVTARDEFLP